MMQENTEKKKKRGCLKAFLIAIGIIVLGIIVLVIVTFKVASNYEGNESELLIDASQLSGIDAAEVAEMMGGEASDVEEWTIDTSDENVYTVTSYWYEDENKITYEFRIIDGSLARLVIYSEKYWTGSGEDIQSKKTSVLYNLLGISVGDDFAIENSSDYELTYINVSDQITELKILGIDEDEDTLEQIYITYEANPVDTVYSEDTEEEKYLAGLEERRDEILSKLRIKEDTVELKTWYYDESTPEYSNELGMYIYFGETSDGFTPLRVKFQYDGDEWTFFDELVINIDDTVYNIYLSDTEYLNKTTKAYTGGVYETFDMVMDDTMYYAMILIPEADNVVIRFKGDTNFDYELSEAEKQAFRNVVEAYQLITGEFVWDFDLISEE